MIIVKQTTIMLTEYSQISEQSLYQQAYSQSDLHKLQKFIPDQPINIQDQYIIPQYSYIDQSNHHPQMSNFQKDSLIKINQQTNLIIELQEKNYYYRSQCLKLIEENGIMRQSKKVMEQQHKIMVDKINKMETERQNDVEKIKKCEQEMKIKEKCIQELKKQIYKQKTKQKQQQRERQVQRQRWIRIQKERQRQREIQRENMRLKQKQIQKQRERWRQRQRQKQIQRQRQIQRSKQRQRQAAQSFLPHTFINKQLLHQQKIIVDLRTKNQQLLKINIFLQHQLKTAQQKLIQTQIQNQNKLKILFNDNFIKLKQNKTNLIDKYKQQSKFGSKKSEQQQKQKINKNINKQYKTLQKYNFNSINNNNIIKDNIQIKLQKLQPIQDPKPYRKMNNTNQLENIKRKYLQ